MLDSRTKRTLIRNSPVTTQTPSWIFFRSTLNVLKNSTYRSIVPGIHPFTITDTDISLLRTSRRSNYSPLTVLEILRLFASRIRISSLLIDLSFRGFSAYDLLRCDFATPDLTPRTRLDDQIHISNLFTRKDIGVLEDISTRPSEKVGHCPF